MIHTLCSDKSVNITLENNSSPLTSIKNSLAKYPHLDLGIIIIKDNLLYAGVIGNAALTLKRGDQKITILKSVDHTPVTASGPANPGDKFSLNISNDSLEIPISEEIEKLAPVSNKKIKISSPTINIKRSFNIRSKASSVLSKLISKLPEKRLAINPDHVDLESKTKKRTAPLVGAALLGILTISIFFGLKKQRENKFRASYEDRLQKAIHQFEESVEVAPLSKTRAKELVLGARTTAQELQSEGISDPDLENLANNIQKNLGAITGIYETNSDLFLDLSLISQGFEPKSMGFSDNNLLVLDKDVKKVVSISSDTKKTETISDLDLLPDASVVVGYADRAFTLSSDGIREVGEEIDLVIKPEWDGDILLAAFAGNIYVLDKSENTISRHSGVKGGFLDSTDWLAPGINVDLTNSISWAIDSSIWILDDSGRIKKFTQGSPQNFSTSGVTGDFANARQIFTDEETEFLYILDPQNKRVVVLNKSGNYVAEYISEELKGSEHFAVSEQNNLLIFMAQSKLFSTPLKHL